MGVGRMRVEERARLLRERGEEIGAAAAAQYLRDDGGKRDYGGECLTPSLGLDDHGGFSAVKFGTAMVLPLCKGFM
jgi:hypothetical protein